MQDKEFDRLFNSKLDNFEMEPSPMVWENIADELHGKKARRSIVPYLSIAASIIILISVGLLFFNQTENTFVKPVKRGKVVVKTKKPAAPEILAKNKVTPAPATANTSVNKGATVSKSAVFIAPKLVVSNPASQIIAETNDRVMIDPITTNQPALAITAPVQKEPAMVVPGKETSFAATTTDKQQIIKTVTTEITSTETMKTPVKKRGIHSLGGLINAIVAKVDKREDKLIEFSDSEDDDTQSNVTGVNLGLIRIKKQQ